MFLSEQLECSERYIASLLQSVMAENPNITPISCIEVTVAQFHQRRRHIVDSLRYLLEAADVAEQSDAGPTFRRLQQFVRLELIDQGNTRHGDSLATKIFKEVERIDGQFTRALTARRNAVSNSTAPSRQGMHYFLRVYPPEAHYSSIRGAWK
jgi:nuclear pore complex protein Nup205